MRIVFIGHGRNWRADAAGFVEVGARSRRRCDSTRQTSRALSIDRSTADKKALSGTNIPVLQPARIKERQAIEEIRA